MKVSRRKRSKQVVIRNLSTAILVVASQPRRGSGKAVLVPSFGRQIHVVICDVHHVQPTRVTRVGMEHLAVCVLMKHTDARGFLTREFLHVAVVVYFAFRPFIRRERLRSLAGPAARNMMSRKTIIPARSRATPCSAAPSSTTRTLRP